MRPLDGRRLWFVGIGGAGLSAYAQLARAWGAEVGGWDRVETPYLERARRRRASRSRREPVAPDGWEASSRPRTRRAGPAARRVPRRARRRCGASIVVAGTHGKGTTAAMIAFVLRETGRDPAWLIGAPVPQLGATRARARGGSSSRATSRTGRCSACRPRSRSSRTSSSTTTPSSARWRSSRRAFARWTAACARGRPRRAAVRGRARACRASTTG